MGPEGSAGRSVGARSVARSSLESMNMRTLSWLVVPLFLASALAAQEKPEGRPEKPEGKSENKPDFPSFEEVSKDFEKVVSTAEGTTFYGLWQRKKDGQMLAELPAGYANQKQFFALTMPTGELFAGLQLGEYYVQWK